LISTPATISDTRWRFGSDGTCDRTVIITQLDTSVETASTRACTFTLTASSLRVIFEGSTFPSTFGVAFSNGELLLDGFRFQRSG
jgi:hypothetical protein